MACLILRKNLSLIISVFKINKKLNFPLSGKFGQFILFTKLRFLCFAGVREDGYECQKNEHLNPSFENLREEPSVVKEPIRKVYLLTGSTLYRHEFRNMTRGIRAI